MRNEDGPFALIDGQDEANHGDEEEDLVDLWELYKAREKKEGRSFKHYWKRRASLWASAFPHNEKSTSWSIFAATMKILNGAESNQYGGFLG